jgi:hypothetical protein
MPPSKAACLPSGPCAFWLLRQVQYVKGLDLSPNEIDEARRRYEELVAKSRGKVPPA